MGLADEFKPASIDTGSPGTLHKGAENKVTVEWSNNQAGKPKVAFQGNSEDAKDFDAVIFFDGTSFRLERLHRAVKSLRHLRQGETAAALAGSGGGGGSGAVSPIHSNGGHANAEKNQFKAHHVCTFIPCSLFVAFHSTSRMTLANDQVMKLDSQAVNRCYMLLKSHHRAESTKLELL